MYRLIKFCFHLVLLLFLVWLFSAGAHVAADDSGGLYPPYTQVKPSGYAAYPSIGDCATVRVLWVLPPGQGLDQRDVRYCITGYVTWLVGQPVAYYLEDEVSHLFVVIWTKETVDEYFHRP